MYLTTSATDAKTLVWDVRVPLSPLHTLSHGPTLMPTTPATSLEDEDTGVTYAQWGPDASLFLTGSSDGIIKAWDVTRGSPFIKDVFRGETQIMSAALSPGRGELLVGECSGKATVLSTRGDGEAERFEVGYVGRREVVEEENDEVGAGRRAAEELVRTGRMVIRDGSAWATGR